MPNTPTPNTPTPEQLEFYASVVVTAVEQSVTSFDYRNYGWGPKEGPVTSASVLAYDREAPSSLLSSVLSDELHSTFENMLEGPVEGLHERLRCRYIAAWLTTEGGDIDAEDADYIMQYHVLGEVIYG